MSKLNDDDRRAVDIVFESQMYRKPSVGEPGSDGFSFSTYDYGTAPLPLRRRLDAVSALLDLLKELPAADPSPDLLNRTLRAIQAPQLVQLPHPLSSDPSAVDRALPS